ncbi:hypothetical protein T484DRAFT_3633609 [Baffinella frigidus]|nr:hypothetical protein T484DRAFT_3633609 [Cryptophyta sp. CCMP2293]
MTIDRSFIENFKAITPQAFDTSPPDNVSVVFIDGQLNLQCPEGIHCYFEFFVALYKRMIDRYLAMEDVKTVILGFDDSTNSPFAKAATQAKRRSRCEVVQWSELQPLDNMIPANHATLLFNSNYKTRVIKCIIQQVTEHCKVKHDQRVVIDHMGSPFVAVGLGSGCPGTHSGASGAPEQAIEFEIACPLGECDVKWVRYCPWGDMILDAVDSDYVIIGLCVMERLGRTAPRIFVKRLLLEPGNAALAVAANDGGGPKKKAAGQKRKCDMFAPPGIDDNKENVPPSDTAPVVKKPREYEYANCGIIATGLRATLGKYTPDALKPHTMRILAHLVALCGCDFTRGVKWFNATAAFKNAALIWPGMCTAANVNDATGTVSMCPRLVAEHVIGVLWKEVQFKKLCGNSAMKNADFETLFNELSRNTSISAFRRERLVTPMELCCLVRSANWCVLYWEDAANTPCSLTGGDFGFSRPREGGAVQFDDKVPLPPKVARKMSLHAVQALQGIVWPP